MAQRMSPNNPSMNYKITLNDLKMAEHLLEENCRKIVEIFFSIKIEWKHDQNTLDQV
jgi:hypothetical protein